MRPVPGSAIEPHPLSTVEVDCRLFLFEGRLFRGANGEKARFLQSLWQEGLIQRLVEKRLLVETRLSDLAVEGFDVVFEHRALRFQSFPFEWCSAMLRSAALQILDLSLELNRHSLVLADPHSWNVLFEGTNPLYVDLGSIVPAPDDTAWTGREDFLRFVHYPLLLMAGGQPRLARSLLRDGYEGVLEREARLVRPTGWARWERTDVPKISAQRVARSLTPGAFREPLRRLVHGTRRAIASQRPASERRSVVFEAARRRILGLRFTRPPSEWASYADSMPDLDRRDLWSEKQHGVHDALVATRPSTVLELASNRGWYSRLAARLGCQAVAFDNDDESICRLFADAAGSNLSVLPLVMNVVAPDPGWGLQGRKVPDAASRLGADFVIALALVHHLALAQHHRFSLIGAALSEFTRRWLLVEWIPREDEQLSQWPAAADPSYSLERLTTQLAAHDLYEVRRFPSTPSPRELILFERRAPRGERP